MLFPDLNPTALQSFATEVRNNFPGGTHIGDHAIAGPWTAMSFTTFETRNWLLLKAVETFPSVELACANYWDGGLDIAHVYLFPQFVYDLAVYMQDEYTLSFNDEQTFTIDVDWAGADARTRAVHEELVAAGMLFDITDTTLLQAYEDACAALGGAEHLNKVLVRAVNQQSLSETPVLTDFLEALGATAT